MAATLDRVKITYTKPGEGQTTEYVSCSFSVQDLYDRLNYISANYNPANIAVSIAPALNVAGLDAVVKHLEALHPAQATP